MLLEWKKVVTWIIQILCKMPFYALIVKYFKSELRFYTHAVFLEDYFSAIVSFLILTVSNKNTIMVFTVIFIVICPLCAIEVFKQLNNKSDNNYTVTVVFILFFVINFLFEIISIFVIITLPTYSFQSSFFLRKLSLSAAKFVLITLVFGFVGDVHNEQQLQSRSGWKVLWIIINTVTIVLYTYNVSYQLNNELSVIFLLSIFVVYILWILVIRNCKAACAALALIVVFSVHCFFWYKLNAVKLISLTVAEFISQFTMIGALLFAVAHS